VANTHLLLLVLLRHIVVCTAQQPPDRTTAKQAKADLIHTWQRLTFVDYEEFWYASLENDDEDNASSAIATNGMHFLYSVTITVVAMALYWFLVGGKCWEKY
jgi:hypothetical protein